MSETPSKTTSKAPAKRSAEEISAIMRKVHGRDTTPELALRRALWARGLRYRADLPARLAAGQRVFARVDTAHGAIPVAGPPVDPLAVMLARLPVRLAAISAR